MKSVILTRRNKKKKYLKEDKIFSIKWDKLGFENFNKITNI